MYKFQFEADDFSIRFTLLGKISRLYGDSGIGKSYILDLLKFYSSIHEYRDNPMLSNLRIITDNEHVKMLKDNCLRESTEGGKLYIIDNMEAYAYDNELLQCIKSLSHNNHILLIGRVPVPVDIQVSNLLHLEHDNGVWEILPMECYAYLYKDDFLKENFMKYSIKGWTD